MRGKGSDLARYRLFGLAVHLGTWVSAWLCTPLRAWSRCRLLWAVLAGLLLVPSAMAATCFAIDDDSGTIVTFNRDAPLTVRFTTTIAGFDTTNGAGAGIGERYEAAVFDAVQNRYYVIDQGGDSTTANVAFPNRLGWVDPFSGVLTYVGPNLGTATVPAIVAVGIGAGDDARIVGLARNPVSNRWYALRRSGHLFEINVATGAFVPGAFSGNDFLLVRNPDNSVDPTFEDLAFDAAGALYALRNDVGPTQFLQNISLITGVAASTKNLGVDETEGLALTNGELRVIIGANGSAATVRDVYRLDTTTGALALIFKLPNVVATAADYEAKGCNDSYVRADLALTKTVLAPAAGGPGKTFTFVMTVVHQGIDPAYRVQITDALPTGLTYASHTIAAGCGVCSFDSLSGVWTIAEMDIGQRRTLSLVVSSASAAPGSVLTNRAQVTQMCESATGLCVPMADFDSTPNNKSGAWSPTEDDEAIAQVVITLLPAVTKQFNPTSGLPGSTAQVVISLTNPNISATATLTAFTDQLPSGMFISTIAATATNCIGATLTAAPGGTSIALVGAPITLLPSASCQITASIVVQSGVGFYVNTIPAGSLSTSLGTNGETTTATYQVTPANVSVLKDFALDAIGVGQTTTLKISFNNPTAITATFSTTFVDNFPSGLTIANPSAVATNCVGTGGPNTTTTSLSLPTTRGVPPNGNCTLTAVVTSAAIGAYTNTIATGGVNTRVGSNLATSTAVLIVDAPSIVKEFNPTSIQAGGAATLTLILSNPLTRSATLTAVFTDVYPAGLVNTNPVVVGDNCPAGAATANIGGNTVTLAIGTIIPPLGSCRVFVRVTAAANGVYVNTVPIGSLTTGLGSNSAATQATLTVSTLTDLAVTKRVNLATATVTQTLSYTVTVVNLGPSIATAAKLVDIFGGVNLTGVVRITSTAAATTVTAIQTSASGFSATMTIGINQTLTFVFSGTPTIYNGFLTNSASVSAGTTQVDANLTNNNASVVTLLTPTANLQVTKTNGVTSLVSGQTTTYTLTFSNAGLSAADGTVVRDISSAGLDCVSLVCTASGGASCGSMTLGALMSGHPLPTFPNGGGVQVILTCRVTATGT